MVYQAAPATWNHRSFVSRASASPGKKTQEPECLSSSETFDFGSALLELEGPGLRFPDEAPRPPGGSGATYRSRRAAGAAQTWAGSPPRHSRGAARPSGIARPRLGANAPRAAVRRVPGHRRLCASGEEGGAARSPSHSKATRVRGSGSAQRAHGVQGGDPQP